MSDRRRGDRRKGFRRKSDRIKRMVLLIVTIVAFILLNIRITFVLLSAPLSRIIIFMGLALPIGVTMIIIIILVERIREIKVESSFDFKDLSILVAEPNIVNREILIAIMEKTGITIDFAETGQKVISMFRENLNKYNLIFMDTQATELNGLETARNIRAIEDERGKTVPIVAMISGISRDRIDDYLAAGINDHIDKPFDPDSINLMIKKRALLIVKSRGETKKRLEQGIAWNEGFSLGDEQVDAQHHQMFALVSSLVNECAGGMDSIKTKETLDFLVNFAVQHFNDEETLMLHYNYPDLKNHKILHEKFKNTIGDFAQKFEKNGASVELSNDIIKTVVRWLTSHIMQEDKKIVAHIRRVNLKK